MQVPMKKKGFAYLIRSEMATLGIPPTPIGENMTASFKSPVNAYWQQEKTCSQDWLTWGNWPFLVIRESRILALRFRGANSESLVDINTSRINVTQNSISNLDRRRNFFKIHTVEENQSFELKWPNIVGRPGSLQKQAFAGFFCM